MEDINIQGGKITPSISLKSDGHLKFSGRSIHEDPDDFFAPVVNWIKEYCEDPPVEETVVDVALEYFNSGSAKFMLTILQILVDKLEWDHQLNINWHYETGDDDILERGEYYSSLLNKRFNFIEVT